MMKASELIENLQAMIAKHGDRQVLYGNDPGYLQQVDTVRLIEGDFALDNFTFDEWFEATRKEQQRKSEDSPCPR